MFEATRSGRTLRKYCTYRIKCTRVQACRHCPRNPCRTLPKSEARVCKVEKLLLRQQEVVGHYESPANTEVNGCVPKIKAYYYYYYYYYSCYYYCYYDYDYDYYYYYYYCYSCCRRYYYYYYYYHYYYYYYYYYYSYSCCCCCC